MKKGTWLLCILSAMLLALSATAPAADKHHHKKLAIDKVKDGLSLIVLGSGGPVAASEGRASAGYLILVDREPRILMDMGGGTFKSLAQSGAQIPDLAHFLITHLHLDHMGDMSAIVKTLFFHNRRAGTFRAAPLRFYGPEMNGIPFPPAPPLADGAGVAQYPHTSEYVDGHFDIRTGVDRYLNAFALGIEAGVLKTVTTDLPSNFRSPAITTVFEDPDGLTVSSIAVNHGPVPGVAYRVEYGGKSIVFSGDTSSRTDNMIDIADNADLLIYDTAIMADQPPPDSIFHKLHTTPERIGEVAVAANPATLLLSHITPVTDPRIDEVKHIIRAAGYTGRLKVARDLQVFNLHGHDD